MTILLTSPNNPEFQNIEKIIKEAITKTNNTVLGWEDSTYDLTNGTLEEAIDVMLDKIDLLIANLSENHGDTSLEVGFALGKKKAVLIICEKKDLDTVKPDYFGSISIVYDKTRIQETLIDPLLVHLNDGSIAKYLKDEKAEVERKKEIKTIFVSYAHSDLDASFLERLIIHVRPFEKSGLIDFWSDKKIKAGDKWKDKIIAALDKAAIAVLLISADFLASDFIIDNELPPLLKAAESKGTIILPVILRPCRFTKTDSLSIFQSINDPKIPLSKMDESSREEIYVKICDYIDTMIK